MATTTDPAKQAEAAKRKGNIYFKKEKLGAAIEAYTEAITLCPKVPIYWTNRALCERKRNEWEKVESDCRKALELDNKSVKGHYMLGLALLHYQQYARAVAELEKALDLGRGATHGNSYMVEEIWQELATARYTQWEEDANARRQQLQELQTFLQYLLRSDNQRRLKEIISVMFSTENPLHDQSPQQDGGADNSISSEDEKKIRYPKIYETEDTVGKSCNTAEEKVGSLYPPVFGEDSDHARGNSTREEGGEEEEDLRMESKIGTDDGISEEQKKSNAPGFLHFQNKSHWHRRKSLQIRLQKFMQSGYFHSDGVEADSNTDTSEQNEETEPNSGDEKIPYSMYDVYKVFKELVKLQKGEAGKELLRTTELYERRSKVLNDLFKKLATPDVPGEIPDHLCCTITMEIFRDPVITPSGISYERAAIEEHLKQVGSFDPVTRTPLTVEQVYPNLALRDAVQSYLVDHGWAYRA